MRVRKLLRGPSDGAGGEWEFETEEEFPATMGEPGTFPTTWAPERRSRKA